MCNLLSRWLNLSGEEREFMVEAMKQRGFVCKMTRRRKGDCVIFENKRRRFEI